MKHIIFSIFDSATGLYQPPFYDRAEGQAIRNFMQAAEDSNSMLAKHPQDFTLMKLGTFDDTTSKFDLAPTPIRVYSLSQNIDVNQENTNEISNDPSVFAST